MPVTDARAVFDSIDRPLWLLTAAAGDRRGGMILTYVSAASLVPELPRVLIGVAKHHHTWSLLEAAGTFALHLLEEGHLEWVWHFGLRSGRDCDKLAGVATRTAVTGSPVLPGFGYLDCRVEARLDSGDRTVYMAEVLEAGPPGPTRPLTVGAMLQRAGPGRVAELRALQARDTAIDAAAIRAWRQRG